MKVARIAFSRMAINGQNKFTTDTFTEMMGHLPKGSNIVGFGNSSEQFIDYIFIENDIFMDINPGGTPPDINVMFGTRPDGTAYCSGVDWHLATPKITALTGNVTASGSSGFRKKPCATAKNGTDPCEYVFYQGQFNQAEEICKHCGDPKP